MDQHKQSPQSIMQPSSFDQLPPAQLWLGNHEELTAQTEQLLQKMFCLNEGCGTCAQCQNIAAHQHHAATWLYPEKQYTLESLRIIFDTISFTLNPGQHHFFIIQKSDFLTPACSNSLLKSIEEPPPGYHFILLAQRQERLLQTIQSRCLITSFYSENNNNPHADFFAFLTSTKPANPIAFQQELDRIKINERESIELLDQLLMHWMKLSKESLIAQEQRQYNATQKVIDILKKGICKPPMPGSSKIFWKNLFLQIKTDGG